MHHGRHARTSAASVAAAATQQGARTAWRSAFACPSSGCHTPNCRARRHNPAIERCERIAASIGAAVRGNGSKRDTGCFWIQAGRQLFTAAQVCSWISNLNGPPVFLRTTVARSRTRPPPAHVVNLQPNRVATLGLAVNRQIRHREIALAPVQLKPHPYRPDVLRPQQAVLADQASLVPGSRRRAQEWKLLPAMVPSEATLSTSASVAAIRSSVIGLPADLKRSFSPTTQRTALA
jgi:hypothetical protein